MRFSPIVLLFFAMLGCGKDSTPAPVSVESQEQPVEAIERLGGQITFDRNRPNKPVTDVDLSSTKVTDDELVHLKGLTNLQYLNLTGTKVTDAGLEHLKGLTSLKRLDLDGTKVTTKGVNKLQKALPYCAIHH